MSSRCYLKGNLFIATLLAALSFSCKTSRVVVNPNYKQPVSYNKVNIDMTSGLLNGGLKGYIYIIPDTQICFRLWGPWGYGIGKGYIYPSKILFYNEMDKVAVPDLKSQIENLSGCVFDLNVFQSLLLGNIDGFVGSLNQLNPALLNIDVRKGYRRSTLRILHKVNLAEMNVYFLYKRGLLKNIMVKFLKDKSFTEVSFEFVDISNDRKICTFAF